MHGRQAGGGPRCEQLCARLPDCVSIDMHRGKPLCYLNHVGCSETEASDDGAYDILTPCDEPPARNSD